MPLDGMQGAKSNSAASDDPNRSSTLPKCQSQLMEGYETGPDSENEDSQAKQFDGQVSGKFYP